MVANSYATLHTGLLVFGLLAAFCGVAYIIFGLLGFLPEGISIPMPAVRASVPAEEASTDAAYKANQYIAEYGGNWEVYMEILVLADCEDLQAIFDTASENNELETEGAEPFRATAGYMVAADERMRELGCD